MTAYEIITEQIIKKMEQGIIPWVKPWKTSRTFDNMEAMFPCYSYSNGKRYDLINQMLLDFEAGEYATFEQIKKAGGKVKKGEHSHIICGWIVETVKCTDKEGNVITDDDGNPLTKKTFACRWYRVFNILTQVEGLKPKHNWTEPKPVEKPAKPTLDTVPEAEAIVKRYIESADAPTLHIKESDSAYYRPSTDEVVVPMLTQYKAVEEYYSTMFHELIHSTGKSTRCNRKSEGKHVAFGSEDYSKEELVAEIGACFLSSKAGLDSDTTFRNSVAYLQSWLEGLKNDPKLIVYASSQAEKGCEYILNA